MKRKKRRGRPKLKATKEREKEQRAIAKVVREARKRAPMSDEERQETQTLLNSLAGCERQILQQYHVPPMKKELAYAVASIGDESLEGYEEVILNEYRQALSIGKQARAEGSESNQKRANDWRTSIISKHANVINRLTNQGRSKSSIADVIIKKLGHEIPLSVRTVRRWVADYQAGKLAKPLAKKNN